MTAFKLNNREKITTGFKVPEHYFEDFSAKVMQQINAEEQTKVISFADHKRKTWFYAVAAILIMALMVPVYTNYQSKKIVDPESIENYISYQSTISQYDLIDLLDDQDIDKLDIDMDLEKKTIEEVLVNSADLENYLID
jgi:hypothetical protein